MHRRGVLKGIGGIGAVLASIRRSETVSADGVTVEIVEADDPVDAGEFLDVVAEVENASESAARPELEFAVGGERRITKATTIDGGESDTIEFSHRTFPVREDVEFPVSVDGSDDGDERIVDVRGIDELDGEHLEPASRITVQPGTSVLFAVEADALGEHGGRTHWYLENEYSGWSHGPWNWAYYDSHAADHWRRTFESEGTYRVAATVRGDDENYTARWTVEVSSAVAGAPVIEGVSPNPGPLELSSGETVELEANVSDPGGDLDRVVWWLAHADAVLGVSDLDGAEDVASISTDELCHGCPVLLWAIDERGAVTEERVWTPRLTYDGPTRLTIVATNDPVEAGGFLEVTVEVENVDDGEVTEDVELVVGEERVDAESVTLHPGSTETVTLGYETYPVATDVAFPVSARTESDRDSRTVDVHAEAGPIEMTILEASDPVRAGEFLEVEAAVTNAGSATVTEEVHLEAGDRVDGESVTLRPDESEIVTLGYETYPVQVDVEFPVVVYGDGTRDSRTVRVFADEVPPVSIDALETNDPVGAGEFLEVDAAVTNVGDGTIEEDVDLVVGGEHADGATVTLARGETARVELGYETYPVERDVEFPVTVASAGVSEERTVEVYGTDAARLAVTDVRTNDPGDPDGALEVTAEVENVGGTATDHPTEVTLSLDGGDVAREEIALEPGESTAVTFTHEVAEDGAGGRTVSVRTPHDEGSVEVTIGESIDPSLEVVDYHVLGDDPDDEYVTLRNAGEETLEMSGWIVADAHRVSVNLSPFEFPDGFTLEPGAEVTIVSGTGVDTDDTLHWDAGYQVWNQEDGDVVEVHDDGGDVVLEYPIRGDPDDGPEEDDPDDGPKEDELEDEEPRGEESDGDESADPAALELADFSILGDDPNQEYVRLRNAGEETLEMAGWSVEDAHRVNVNLSPFEFPDGFTLEPGAEVTIVSGTGVDTDDTLHWDAGYQIWNEEGDVVVVRDAGGNVVLEASIEAESDEESEEDEPDDPDQTPEEDDGPDEPEPEPEEVDEPDDSDPESEEDEPADHDDPEPDPEPEPEEDDEPDDPDPEPEGDDESGEPESPPEGDDEPDDSDLEPEGDDGPVESEPEEDEPPESEPEGDEPPESEPEPEEETARVRAVRNSFRRLR